MRVYEALRERVGTDTRRADQSKGDSLQACVSSICFSEFRAEGGVV